MKQLIILSIFLTILAIPSAKSQTNKCETIIGKTAREMSKGGVDITFSSITTSGNRMIQEMAGKITVKGEKFLLQSSIMDMGYDGKTAWSYIKGADEVNLTEPTEEELITINPYILLNNYKKLYKAEYKGKKEGYEIISFVPVSTNADIKCATVSIDAGRSCPALIEIVNRDASKTVININKYESGIKTDDSIFEFSPKNYPNAEIADLR